MPIAHCVFLHLCTKRTWNFFFCLKDLLLLRERLPSTLIHSRTEVIQGPSRAAVLVRLVHFWFPLVPGVLPCRIQMENPSCFPGSTLFAERKL